MREDLLSKLDSYDKKVLYIVFKDINPKNAFYVVRKKTCESKNYVCFLHISSLTRQMPCNN